MTDASSSTTDLLQLVLAPERSIDERLASLSELHELLEDPAARTVLTAHLSEEPSTEVRAAILRQLVETPRRTASKADPAYRDALYRSIAFEPASEVRAVALEGLLDLLGTDAGTEPLVVAVLTHELDPETQRRCLDALAGQPGPAPETIDTLAQWAPRAARALGPALLQLASGMGATPARPLLAALLAVHHKPEVRTGALRRLRSYPELDARTAIAVAEHLDAEVDPDMVAQLLGLLLMSSDTDPTLPGRALDLMVSRAELAPALPLLRQSLDAAPVLVSRLIGAFDAMATDTGRMQLLSLLAQAGDPTLIVTGLTDPNPWVRQHAGATARRYLDRFPEQLLPALAQAYRTETQLLLRRHLLAALAERPMLDDALADDLLADFGPDTDPTLRRSFVDVITRIPPSGSNQQALLRASLSLLEDPALTAECGDRLVKLLQTFQYAGSPELEDDVLRLLENTVDFTVFAILHPIAVTACRDEPRLLRASVDGLYRFIDQYPAEPLSAIVSLVGERTASVPGVEAELGHIVALTRASWLLESATESRRIESTFDQVWEHFHAGEWDQMASLLRQGYEDRVLKKSQIVRLYLAALVHPDLDRVFDAIVPMMREAGVVTDEVMARSLAFLARYPVRNRSAHAVSRYLAEYGPSTLGYADTVSGLVTQTTYRLLSRLRTEPPGGNRHGGWPLLDLLSDRDERVLLRSLLGQPVELVDGTVPFSFQSLHAFALDRLSALPGHDLDDLAAVALAYRATGVHPQLQVVTEEAARLFAEMWRRLSAGGLVDGGGLADGSRSVDESRSVDGGAMPDTVTAVAADVFADQIGRWLALGGLAYPERVAPMAGIDLDRLQREWAGTDDEWADFLAGYGTLLIQDGLDEIPPAPSDRVLPPPTFAPLSRQHGLFDVVRFLVCCAPPSDPGFQAAWRDLQAAARQELPQTFAAAMESASEAVRARTLRFLAGAGTW